MHATDAVYHSVSVCDEAGVPHPTIISESGRAVVAHHSPLRSTSSAVPGFMYNGQTLLNAPTPDPEQPLVRSAESRSGLTAVTPPETALMDRTARLDTAMNSVLGRLSACRRAAPDGPKNLYWAISAAKLAASGQL